MCELYEKSVCTGRISYVDKYCLQSHVLPGVVPSGKKGSKVPR